MYLAKILIYISILIWLLPPFRQLKGGYFLYFLILGYSDPLALLLLKFIKLNANYTHLIVAFLLAISILYYAKNLNVKWGIILFLFLILSLFINIREIRYFSIISFHGLILSQLLILSIKEFYQESKINLYYFVLLVYELATIFKYIAFVYNYTSGVYYFYLSAAFEMLICIYFIFFNFQNSPYIKAQFASKKDF